MQYNDDFSPASAQEWFDAGVSFRQQGRFGDAVNAFSQAISVAEGLLGAAAAGGAEASCASAAAGEAVGVGVSVAAGGGVAAVAREIIVKSRASIDLIGEITGFVNKDLMNP